MLNKIYLLITGFFSSLKIFDKWFKPKTPGEKIEDKKKGARKETDDFKETGRPDWD